MEQQSRDYLSELYRRGLSGISEDETSEPVSRSSLQREESLAEAEASPTSTLWSQCSLPSHRFSEPDSTLIRHTAPPSAPTRSTLTNAPASRIRFVDASYLPPERNIAVPSPGRNPRRRKVITTFQLERLVHVFDRVDTPGPDVREGLGAELDMTPREVQIWFQNRRAKVKREREATAAHEAAQEAGRSQSRLNGSSSLADPPEQPTSKNQEDAPRSFMTPVSLLQCPTRNRAQSASALCSDPTLLQELTLLPVDPRAATDSPRYRQIFGERRISLPKASFLPFASPLSSHSDNSTTSSDGTSYFPSRILPSPSSSVTSYSPLGTFGRLSICSPLGRYDLERDPFFPPVPTPGSRRESELIELAPIIESIPPNDFALDALDRGQSDLSSHPRGRSSLEDLLNPSLPSLVRRSSSSF